MNKSARVPLISVFVIFIFCVIFSVAFLPFGWGDIIELINGESNSPDSEFSSQKILWLNITKIEGFERYIILDISKENETRFAIRYKLNESLKTEIDTCNALSLSTKETCFNNVKKDYVDEISKNDFDNSINALKDYSKENLTANLRIEGRIDLSSEGVFYIDVLNYDSKNLTKSIGERFKIGFNTITVETVESANDVGFDSSIALDSSGIVHIAHFDNTNNKARYCNNSEGAWSCDVADSGTNVGFDTSIAIDSTDVVHISNKDSSPNFDLRYCNNSGGAWSCVSIDTGGNVGSDSSIAIDSTDVVHISHRNSTSGDSIRYCNNSEGAWSCYTIFNSASDTFDTSIAIDSTDVVHISFVDGAGDDSLYYANNSGGAWSSLKIDTVASSQVGWGSSIAIDSTDMIHISHFDTTLDNLRYCNNTAGSWSCDTIEDGGDKTAIAIDSVDNPHIFNTQDTTGLGPAVYRHCFKNITNSWSCQNISTDGSISGNSQDRAIAIKKGRMVDSTSFDTLAHVSFFLDSGNNLGYAKINISNIFSELIYPLDNSWNNTLIINFTCNSSHTLNLLKNTTLYIWNSTIPGLVNNTENKTITGGTNSSNFTIVLLQDNTYEWNCYSCDTNHQCDFADSNFTINLDTIFPIVNITNIQTASGSLTIDANYTVSDTNLESCKYSVFDSAGLIDGVHENVSVTCGVNITGVSVSTFATYNLTIYANDSANNENSTTETFTVSVAGGGQGGGRRIAPINTTICRISGKLLNNNNKLRKRSRLRSIERFS